MDDVYLNHVWYRGEGEAFQKTDPVYGGVSYHGHAASQLQVKTAVAQAKKAQIQWARTSLDERITILEAYASLLKENRETGALMIARDMGKPLWEARTEIDAMAAKVAISIVSQAERAGTKSVNAPFGNMALSHRPHGVMAIFGPFNFPGHLANGHIVPAILAGNGCVFKPSELAPSVAVLMADLMTKAGLPEGLLQIVQGGRETGKALLESEIDGLMFTGSYNTGRAFHAHFAGRPEVILALEMGGNNPLIAWPDGGTDLEAMVDIIQISAFVSSGQRCSCARRLILPDTALGHEIIDRLISRLPRIKIGAYDDDQAWLGSLVDERAALSVISHYKSLEAQGAGAIHRPEGMALSPAFVRPSVIDMTAMDNAPDEEVFGPLLQVYRVKSLQEAIYRANLTRFGLAAGVLTDNDEIWKLCEQELKAGVITRNRPTAGAPSSLPFGGPGCSGNHRPSAYYAADYCAWPQALQAAPICEAQTMAGFPGSLR
jgi:succinylglutamic semialdehyde dehydrogenase